MDNDPKEIELKLRVAPEDVATLQADPHFAGGLGEPVSEMLVSVYFDSNELFLRDHGLTLRVRHIGDKRIQTIKSADHGIFERSEWEQPIESDQPNLALAADTPLAPLLTDDIRNALKPVFETRIERTAYHLNGGDTDITIAFDEGRIVATGSSSRYLKSNWSSSAASLPSCSSSRARSATSYPRNSMSKASQSGASTWSRKRRSLPRRPMSRN